MHHQPYFSIIIPTCNRESLLMQCLLALKRQSFHDFEVLVVDDGDRINHKALETSIMTLFDNATLLLNVEKGAAHARNRGKTHSKGKYVIFLDDDEFFKDDYLYSLHDFIQTSEDKYCVVKTGTLFETKEGHFIKEGHFASDISLLPQIWKYGASMSDYCFDAMVIEDFFFDSKGIPIEDFLILNQILSKHKGVFTPIFGVKIPFHHDRISYKKFDSAYKHMKVELAIINEAYTINKDVISFKTAWKKSMKTILAYGKRITKTGNIGQIGKLILTSTTAMMKLIKLGILNVD